MNQNMYSTEPENSLTTENCHTSAKNTEIYCTLYICKKSRKEQHRQHLVTPPYNKHEQKKKWFNAVSKANAIHGFTQQIYFFP